MFYAINEEIIKISEENNLSCGDMLVLAYILSFTSNNQECKPSLETIAKNTLLSKMSVTRSLNKLKELNLINVETKKGIRNIYTSNKMLHLDKSTSNKMLQDQSQNVTGTSNKMLHNNTIYNTLIDKKKNIKKKNNFDNYNQNQNYENTEYENNIILTHKSWFDSEGKQYTDNFKNN